MIKAPLSNLDNSKLVIKRVDKLKMVVRANVKCKREEERKKSVGYRQLFLIRRIHFTKGENLVNIFIEFTLIVIVRVS